MTYKQHKKLLADNILKLVKHHKKNCDNNCGIQLFLMKEVFEYYKGSKATEKEANHFF